MLYFALFYMEVIMVETIEKYNLKETIENIEKHILSCDLSDSEKKI